MQARMTNPAILMPKAMAALMALGKSITGSTNRGTVPTATLNLVILRASQINGCGVCVHMHSRDAKKAGETDERLWSVASWRETPFFTNAERAALALAESVTRLSDRADPVPDEVWGEAARWYDEASLATLVMTIAAVNLWNRLNAATRQVASEW